jgi:hypothetical protein
MGAALVPPTQPMAGATGYMTLVINQLPNGTLSFAMLAGPNPTLQVWVENQVGAQWQEITQAVASGGSAAINWLTQGGTVTFILIPQDASGNLYQAVETLTVTVEPGIFVSPSTPQSVIASLQANNPGLQTYGTPSQSAAPAPASFSIGDWITGNPLEAAGAALVLVLLLKKL